MRVLCFVLALLSALAADHILTAETASACGVKMTLRAGNVSKRSSNPTKVFVVGVEDSADLARSLRRAGHTVVAVESVAQLDDSASAVVASAGEVAEVRAKRPGAVVVAAGGSVRRTLASLERELEQRRRRRPTS